MMILYETKSNEMDICLKTLSLQKTKNLFASNMQATVLVGHSTTFKRCSSTFSYIYKTERNCPQTERTIESSA